MTVIPNRNNDKLLCWVLFCLSARSIMKYIRLYVVAMLTLLHKKTIFKTTRSANIELIISFIIHRNQCWSTSTKRHNPYNSYENQQIS